MVDHLSHSNASGANGRDTIDPPFPVMKKACAVFVLHSPFIASVCLFASDVTVIMYFPFDIDHLREKDFVWRWRISFGDLFEPAFFDLRNEVFPNTPCGSFM